MEGPGVGARAWGWRRSQGAFKMLKGRGAEGESLGWLRRGTEGEVGAREGAEAV